MGVPFPLLIMQFFLSVYVDDMNTAGKTQNMPNMWAKLQMKVDLDDPVSFSDQVYLGCTQRAAQVNTQRHHSLELRHARSRSKCVERCCELARKTIDQLHGVSTLCWEDHQMRPGDLEIVRGLSEVCSQIVLKCLYLASIGRPHPLWTVNYLARSVTKWNRACDLQLARLISYVHNTTNHRQYCRVEDRNTKQQTGILARRRFRRKFDRLKVNLRWCSVYIWITYVCANFMGL